MFYIIISTLALVLVLLTFVFIKSDVYVKSFITFFTLLISAPLFWGISYQSDKLFYFYGPLVDYFFSSAMFVSGVLVITILYKKSKNLPVEKYILWLSAILLMTVYLLVSIALTGWHRHDMGTVTYPIACCDEPFVVPDN